MLAADVLEENDLSPGLQKALQEVQVSFGVRDRAHHLEENDGVERSRFNSGLQQRRTARLVQADRDDRASLGQVQLVQLCDELIAQRLVRLETEQALNLVRIVVTHGVASSSSDLKNSSVGRGEERLLDVLVHLIGGSKDWTEAVSKDELLPVEWVDQVKRVRVTELFENSTGKAREVELGGDQVGHEVGHDELKERGRTGRFGVEVAGIALDHVACNMR